MLLIITYFTKIVYCTDDQTDITIMFTKVYWGGATFSPKAPGMFPAGEYLAAI